MLHDFLLHASKIQYGLSIPEVKKLAYQFAKRNRKKMPTTWDKSEHAGCDWFCGFMKRFPELSGQSNYSLSRATISPTTTLAHSTTTLRLIWRSTTTACLILWIWLRLAAKLSKMQGNNRVIADKSARQVGKIMSAERGALVPLLHAVKTVSLNCVLIFFPLNICRLTYKPISRETKAICKLLMYPW